MTIFLESELREKERAQDQALFHIIPCPLEKTVSYGKGTAFGPQAILEASSQLERFLDGKEPCKQGIFTHPALDCAPPIEDVLGALRELVREIARSKRLPFTLGGEHSLSYGAVMGVIDGLGIEPKELGLVQVDAHADLRPFYQGEKHSHASVMFLLAEEGVRIASLGVRQLCRQEYEDRKKYNVVAYDAFELVRDNIYEVSLPDDFPPYVYVSFDCDGLDPSVLPATGTPAPGGLAYHQSISLIRSCLVGRQFVGADIVELAPEKHLKASDFTAAALCYQLMGVANKQQIG